MTVALRVVGYAFLAAMVGLVPLVWRWRPDAQDDVERDRRVDRALQRGRLVADEDLAAAPVVLARVVVFAVYLGCIFLGQLSLHLADYGTRFDGPSLVGLGLSGVALVGIVGLMTRMLVVARHQGLRPGRPRTRRRSARRG